MSRPAKLAKRIAARMLAIAVLAGTTVPACNRGPQSPAAAYESLTSAAAASDGAAVFEALDQQTRWSWMTVLRSHREAYDIVLSNYPEGPDRDSNLRRFEAGALAENASVLFATHLSGPDLTALATRLPPTAVFTEAADNATANDRDGAALTFRKLDGRWGYAGFQAAALDAEKRAVADLEMIKRSATDYERAAKRGKP